MFTIKIFNLINRIILAATIILVILLFFIGQFNELPTYNTIIPGDYGAEIRNYLFENIFALMYFFASIILCIIITFYGIALYRNVHVKDNESKTLLSIVLFLLDSGIWILTDSKILSVFTTDYGCVLDKNAIQFISYISFMLLPIIFLSYLHNIMNTRILWKINSLFILNLCIFVVLNFFNLSKKVYLFTLLLHHILIYILMILSLVYYFRCIHKTRHTEDKQIIWLWNGLISFIVFSCLAIIAFLVNCPHAYAIIYIAGFLIMMCYLIRLTIYKMLLPYEQAVKSEVYQHLAYTDVLTDIKNRNAFIAEQYTKPLKKDTCCIVMDLNKLKWINDTLGHEYGDQLIRRSAKVINDSFSDMGVCYRIGGDEFVVICQNTDEASIKQAFEQMEEKIAIENANSELEISIAYGYAFSKNNEELKDLLHVADQNMYITKNKNRL